MQTRAWTPFSSNLALQLASGQMLFEGKISKFNQNERRKKKENRKRKKNRKRKRKTILTGKFISFNKYCCQLLRFESKFLFFFVGSMFCFVSILFDRMCSLIYFFWDRVLGFFSEFRIYLFISNEERIKKERKKERMKERKKEWKNERKIQSERI